VDRVYVDPAVHEYAVRLATATRATRLVGLPDLERYITFGASPRASINLVLSARALAFLRGREYVLPLDVRDMAHDVMRHRLVLSFEAYADGMTSDGILAAIVDHVALPSVQPRPPARARLVNA
jgi:MoxR-like ATPase